MSFDRNGAHINDRDKKHFWLTLTLGSAIAAPHIVVPLLIGGATLWGVGKAVGCAGQGIKALAERRRRRQSEADNARQQKEWEEQRQREEERRERDRPLREEAWAARATVEFLYSLFEAEIRHRFPRTLFQEFLNRFLHDGQSIDLVRHYAAELQHLILQHADKAQPGAKLASIQAVNDWYERQRREIEASVGDELMRESFLNSLRERYQQMMNILLEEMKP